MEMPDYIRENIDLKTVIVTVKASLKDLNKSLESKKIERLIEQIEKGGA